MSERDDPAGSQQALRQEAARWLSRLNDKAISDRERRTFLAWLDASPLHRSAFDEAEGVWRHLRASADKPGIASLRAETSNRISAHRRPRRNRALIMTAAALTVVGIGVFVPYSRNSLAPIELSERRSAGDILESKVGQRLTMTLEDGSSVMLNTASRVRVVFEGKERALFLENGQAFFKVAHGDPRPFIVYARGRSIRAHGTEFDVRVSGSLLQVALVEGLVSVGSLQNDAVNAVRLTPRQLLTVRGNQQTVSGFENLDEVLGWQDGFLFFDDTTLGEAAMEMNRYVENPQIEVQPSVAHVRLSGAFRTGETTAFVEALERGFPVTVVSRTSEAIILGPSR